MTCGPASGEHLVVEAVFGVGLLAVAHLGGGGQLLLVQGGVGAGELHLAGEELLASLQRREQRLALEWSGLAVGVLRGLAHSWLLEAPLVLAIVRAEPRSI